MNKILSQLEPYIGMQLTTELSMWPKNEIGICLVVARIIEGYDSTEENERVVCGLISDFLAGHFKKIKK